LPRVKDARVQNMELTEKEEKIARLALDKGAQPGERQSAAAKLIESLYARGVKVEDLTNESSCEESDSQSRPNFVTERVRVRPFFNNVAQREPLKTQKGRSNANFCWIAKMKDIIKNNPPKLDPVGELTTPESLAYERAAWRGITITTDVVYCAMYSGRKDMVEATIQELEELQYDYLREYGLSKARYEPEQITDAAPNQDAKRCFRLARKIKELTVEEQQELDDLMEVLSTCFPL
jgi:hypothetical protein